MWIHFLNLEFMWIIAPFFPESDAFQGLDSIAHLQFQNQTVKIWKKMTHKMEPLKSPMSEF